MSDPVITVTIDGDDIRALGEEFEERWDDLGRVVRLIAKGRVARRKETKRLEDVEAAAAAVYRSAVIPAGVEYTRDGEPDHLVPRHLLEALGKAIKAR